MNLAYHLADTCPVDSKAPDEIATVKSPAWRVPNVEKPGSLSFEVVNSTFQRAI